MFCVDFNRAKWPDEAANQGRISANEIVSVLTSLDHGYIGSGGAYSADLLSKIAMVVKFLIESTIVI